jgi:hypothetical protein
MVAPYSGGRSPRLAIGLLAAALPRVRERLGAV